MLDKWLAAGWLAIKDMDLEDVAALKLCLMALGILIGLGIPLKKRSAAAVLSSILFVGTYIPLMVRFFGALTRTRED